MFSINRIGKAERRIKNSLYGIHATLFMLLLGWFAVRCSGQDLDQIRASGTLRHLGVPYANFVTGAGDGLDVELVQMFAASLGVKYEYVKTDWGTLVPDLTGEQIKITKDKLVRSGKTAILGDIAASGITVIPWRKQVLAFSRPVFPTQVWLISRMDSPIKPIVPGGNTGNDIATVKALLKGRSLFCKANTCLDPQLYDIEAAGAKYQLFSGALNELAPALLNRETDLTLLDVPDTLVALGRWPGQLKVIGPISEVQEMAAAFRQDSPQLKAAYDEFLGKLHRDGRYRKLTDKYYPLINEYFPDFFSY